MIKGKKSWLSKSFIKLITIFFLIIFLCTTNIQANDESLVGHWAFEHGENLLKATIGSDLKLHGKCFEVEGPDSSNYAVRIGIGNHFIANHGITPKSGESRVNEYTLVMDINVPELDVWHILYQTDPTNNSDGDWTIGKEGNTGIGETGYSNNIIKPKEWYRLAISVINGESHKYYLDGQLINIGYPGETDGRFSLEPTVLLFADENGEDNPVDVADVKIFSKALSNNEMKELGGYGHEVYVEPTTTLEHIYLQSPTPNSIYVGWHQENGLESKVIYSKNTDLSTSTTVEGTAYEMGEGTTWHSVKLEELEANTKYYYQTITGEYTSDIYSFKTAPENESKEGHIRFAVFSDSHQDTAVSAPIQRAMKKKVVELYGEDIESNLNLVICTGDITNSGLVLEQYKKGYFYPIKVMSANVPYMVTIGNHESESEWYYKYMNYEDFPSDNPERYYAYRYGRILFVMINTNSQHRNQKQLDWLDQTLETAQNDSTIDWIFTANHHFGHSELWVDGNLDWVQNNLYSVLKKYPKVDISMNGHTHGYERGVHRDCNMRLLICGGGGGNIDYWGEFINENYPEKHLTLDHYGFMIFDVDISAKRYTANYYSLGNENKITEAIVEDSFYRDKSDTTKPNTPNLERPVGEQNVLITDDLEASKFQGSGNFHSSRFQIYIYKENVFLQLLVDELRHYEDFYGDSGWPEYHPIDLNKDVDLSKLNLSKYNLKEGNDYYWRVKYRNDNLQWSEWSSNGKFKISNSTSNDPETPDEFEQSKLYPNYPNPFNPSTTIEFTLNKEQKATISIYDNNGSLVNTFENKRYGTGKHQIVWNGCNQEGRKLPSGVYYYAINADEFSDVKKAILIK